MLKNPKAEKWKVAFAIVGYMLCSSLMLLSNKVAVHFLPAPSFVLFCQLSLTGSPSHNLNFPRKFCTFWAFGVWACGFFCIEVDSLEEHKVRSYSLVALIFLSTIFANIKILQYSNVETFIVFRASTPLLISVMDWFFLGNNYYLKGQLFHQKRWMCAGQTESSKIFSSWWKITTGTK